MSETALRNEIASRAPGLKVLTVGQLFGKDTLDAVVEDRRGQYLWSVYRRELDPQPSAAVEPLPGQLSFF